MPNYLHRTTMQHLVSVSTISLAEPEANYILMPDLSAVTGQPSKYWTITGDVITLKSQAERDAVDTSLLSDERNGVANQLDVVEDVIRAFALVVLDEINVLRAQHNLADRTIAQLKTAARSKLGT